MERSMAPARSDTVQHPLPGRPAIAWSGRHPARRQVPPGVRARPRTPSWGLRDGCESRAMCCVSERPTFVPGAPAVGGPVNAVRLCGPLESRHRHARLAHAHVDHVGVGVGHCQGAHRRGLEVSVRDILPVCAAVLGLPDPPDTAHVEDRRLSGVAGRGHTAASLERPDIAPPEALQQVRSQVHGHALSL